MGIRTTLCFEISRRLMRPPPSRNATRDNYQAWRSDSLSASWRSFSDADIRGKDVLDFGCGTGELSFYLAERAPPRSIIGVDLSVEAIARAQAVGRPFPCPIEFRVGTPETIPVPSGSIDTLVAFDCLEHVMEPRAIFREWARVLRPGGKCLIEWFPYRGPWGPHMESLIPIPWAHIIFGQRAMFRAAERLYDHPKFVPRHWDLDANGAKRPNKWRAWSSFEEQGYINELGLGDFRSFVRQSGLEVQRLEVRSFSGSLLRRGLGHLLMKTPIIGEYFMSYTVVELGKCAGTGRPEPA